MDARATLNAWRRADRQFALCLVVKTWGSSPRPVGSVMLVDANGHVAGSVSGGCVESAVIEAALRVIESCQPEALKFGAISDAAAWEVGLSCGGEIEVWVVPGDFVPEAFVIGTTPRWQVPHPGGGPAFDWQPETLLPVAIIGAVHIAQELVPILERLDFLPYVLDPRSALATPERFPGLGSRLIAAWPLDRLPALGMESGGFVVALSHDPKIDDPVIEWALRASVPYVGALGSMGTQEARARRLRDQGVTEEQITRLRGPIGLRLGARTPAEIALSIAAEMVQVRRNG